ncbi:MAG TPA: hypothetical protein VD794_15725, partial [Flavisolibacter sp.]|nr:hypothetical protein [Flavisolibacter sp.]
MKNTIRTILYNLAILLVLLVIIELIFGGWVRSSNNLNNLGILRNIQRQHHLDGLYPDSTGIIHYTRDKYGFRGPSIYNTPEKIDILTIGGSTTDQRMLDDSKTWQVVLENNFKRMGQHYLIANAGIDGQSTSGHIKNFELWFPQVKSLKPKYFIFY